MDLTSRFLDLLFPPKCIFCGAVMAHMGDGVCSACTKNLPFIEDGRILRKIGKHTCAVTFYYDGVVRDGIHAMKFHGRRARAERFAPFLARTVAEKLGGEFDAVTYVPIHPLRRIRRGYDQTLLLAEATARLWNVELGKNLRKIRNIPPQSLVKDPEKRRKNVQNAYAVPHPEQVRGRRLLLIDDVVTSGATLTVCADALLAAGAASVVCAALAGGHRESFGT